MSWNTNQPLLTTGLVLITILAGLLAGGAPRAAAADASPPERPHLWPLLYPAIKSGRATPEFLERWSRDPAGMLLESPGVSGAAVGNCVFPGTLEPPAEPDSLNVLHYDLHFLELDEVDQMITAEAVISLEALKALDALDLDCAQLQVSSVEWEGNAGWESLPFTHDGTRIHATLPETVPPFGALRLRVSYGGDPECQGVLIASGMVFDDRGVHTFSQPWAARHWFPCVDRPSDKATASITVDLPADRTAAASGILVSDEPLEGGGHRMRFAMNDPVAPYLMALYVGDFVAIPERTTQDGVPVRGYTYTDIFENTQNDLASTTRMLNFFSTIHPYPFAAYANTIAPFGGGMEHQSNSLIGETFMRGDNSFEYLIAHEAAHQWVGNLITPESWIDIWLNEGFATYYEFLYTEHAYGVAAYHTVVAQTEAGYMFGDSLLQTLNPPQRNPLRNMPPERWYGFEVYDKGAMVVHMLRGLCRFHFMPSGLFRDGELARAAEQGDRLFFDTLGEYFQRHAYGNVTTADLQAVFEDALHENLDWFFDPWLNGTGFPEVEFDYRPIAEDNYHRITMRQTQEWAPFFRMPVHVEHHVGSAVYHQVVALDPVMVSSTLAPISGADSELLVDPQNWMLGTFTEALVEAPPRPGIGLAAPNPSRGGFLLSYDLDDADAGGANGTLQVVDSRGRLVHEQSVAATGPRVEVFWDSRGFRGTRVPSGIYFARLTLENRKTFATRLVVLP